MDVYRPRGRIVTVTAATTPVVSLADMKAQLKVLHADDDTNITKIEAATVAWVERYLQRLLTVRQVIMRLPSLPSGKVPVELYGGRVASITSVIADGTAITGTTAVGDSPALLLPTDDWPAVTGEGLPVTITYTAGFATIPEDIVTAVKLAGEALHDNDERGPMTPAVEALLSRYRIRAL
jgi:ribonuclease PH